MTRKFSYEPESLNKVFKDAISCGDTEMMAFLVARGVEVGAYATNSLGWAAEKGYTDIVKALLAAGVDVHAYRDGALRYAAFNGHAETARVLLESGASIRDETLRLAEEYGGPEVTQVLKDWMGREAPKPSLPSPQPG